MPMPLPFLPFFPARIFLLQNSFFSAATMSRLFDYCLIYISFIRFRIFHQRLKWSLLTAEISVYHYSMREYDDAFD